MKPLLDWYFETINAADIRDHGTFVLIFGLNLLLVAVIVWLVWVEPARAAADLLMEAMVR